MRTNDTMTVKVLDCEGVARSGGSRGYGGGREFRSMSEGVRQGLEREFELQGLRREGNLNGTKEEETSESGAVIRESRLHLQTPYRPLHKLRLKEFRRDLISASFLEFSQSQSSLRPTQTNSVSKRFAAEFVVDGGVTTILSLSFYQVSVILYLFHLLFVSLASLCSCSHLSFLVHQTRLVEKGGENALFVSSYRGGVIAVADGFSSWVEQDVDPSSYVLQRAHGSCFSSVRYDPGFLVAMLEEVGVLKIGNVGDWDYLSFLDKCLAFEKEILIRFHSAGQIIFSTTPQEHYFDCPIHLMLPLYGGGGGSNMTKKIFVAAPDDKAGATSTSVSREVHLPDNEAQRRAIKWLLKLSKVHEITQVPSFSKEAEFFLQGIMDGLRWMKQWNRFIPRLNDLKGGGGQTWGMELMELGREMSMEDDCLLNLLRKRSGRRGGSIRCVWRLRRRSRVQIHERGARRGKPHGTKEEETSESVELSPEGKLILEMRLSRSLCLGEIG
ncbi:hypothetical protein YC2023_015944 [Brassica napus]